MKYASDIEVKLSKEDIDDIKGAGENAGNVLRTKLKETYNVDPDTLEADNSALLKRFGFKIKDGVPTRIKGATHSATSKRIKGGTEDIFELDENEISKITAGGEEAGERLRTILKNRGVDPELIDKNDARLLEQFGFKVKMTKGETPKIEFVEEAKPAATKQAKGFIKSTIHEIGPKGHNFRKFGYLTDL